MVFEDTLFCVWVVNEGRNPLMTEFLGIKIRGGILLFPCLTVFCLIIATQIGVSMKEQFDGVTSYILNKPYNI
jgi:hypothetical protein